MIPQVNVKFYQDNPFNTTFKFAGVAGPQGPKGEKGEKGEDVLSNIEYVTISELMIQNKKINLLSTVNFFEKTKFSFINGTTQLLGIDYEFLDAQTITWDGLGLDNFIESGDIVLIEYF